jgi:hypothetical protein
MPADPFRVAPSVGDPFSVGALGAPFGAQRALDPFATTPPVDASKAQNALADELFNDPSIISSRDVKSEELPFGFDSLGASEDAAGFIVPPSGEMPATSIHEVPDILREAARPEPVKARKAKAPRKPLMVILRPLVKPFASLANVVVLVFFLLTAVVVARGGGPRDIVEGRLVEILLGARGGQTSGDTLLARDVVVTRYPVPAARDLIVITGNIENTGDTPVDGVLVEVTFGEAAVGERARSFTGAAGTSQNPLDLLRAKDAVALFASTEKRAEPIPGHGTVPFVVLASNVDDGARAVVTVREPRVGGPSGGS